MKLPIGICTCGNSKLTPISVGKLISYSESEMKLILESDFCKGKFDHTLTDNIYNSIRSKEPILLENVNSFNKPPLNELAVWLSFKWPIGSIIKVNFLQRDPDLEPLIIKAAKEWETYANITLEFVDSGESDVRISLEQDGTSWSKIGTACKLVTDQNESTMNFGWFNSFTDHDEIRRTTLHEFGHVLGCIHEHQSPDGNIQWDEDKIRSVYIDKLNKTEEWVKINILDKFPKKDISNSTYDEKSIMHYSFDAMFTLDGKPYGINDELSEIDKQFIKMCYPF